MNDTPQKITIKCGDPAETPYLNPEDMLKKLRELNPGIPDEFLVQAVDTIVILNTHPAMVPGRPRFDASHIAEMTKKISEDMLSTGKAFLNRKPTKQPFTYGHSSKKDRKKLRNKKKRR